MLLQRADFETVTIEDLEGMTDEDRDQLEFGVIGFDADTVVEQYNATESQAAGISAGRVLGSRFFEAVAQCMNNFMVAQRFEDEAELDEAIPYVLTLRMRPTRVRLRLLQKEGCRLRYILVQR